MIQEYNRTLEDLTEQINQAVTQIAKEKHALVILDLRAVASLTENVEDVTNEVIKKVKLMRPKAMDE
jgi:Skp family chaperone for outer membrane proteins